MRDTTDDVMEIIERLAEAEWEFSSRLDCAGLWRDAANIASGWERLAQALGFDEAASDARMLKLIAWHRHRAAHDYAQPPGP